VKRPSSTTATQAASGDAEPTIVMDVLRAGGISHAVLLPVVKHLLDPGIMGQSVQATAYTSGANLTFGIAL
jgi:hypothetical protein